MKYKKFIIEKYRAITEPLEVSLDKNSLVPIIGVNECGKTTILQAIFSFDNSNDNLLDGIHLKNVENLYDTSSQESIVSAEIEISWDEIKDRVNNIKDSTNESVANSYKKKKKQFEEITSFIISRNIKKDKYSINITAFNDTIFNDKLCREILRFLPYILYFDDFRDSVEEKIEIKKDENGKVIGWLSIIEQLF